MKPLLLTLAILHGVDAATTHMALTRGYRERVLPLQNPWAIDATVSAEMSIEWIALTKLSRLHPKLSKGLTLSLIGVRAVIVSKNINTLRQ